MIEYLDDPSAITADRLRGGFFEGWPTPPSPERHLAHLLGGVPATGVLWRNRQALRP